MFAEVPLVLEGLVADKTRDSLAGGVHVDHVHAQVTAAAEPAVTQHADLRQRDCNQTYTRSHHNSISPHYLQTYHSILKRVLANRGLVSNNLF